MTLLPSEFGREDQNLPKTPDSSVSTSMKTWTPSILDCPSQVNPRRSFGGPSHSPARRAPRALPARKIAYGDHGVRPHDPDSIFHAILGRGSTSASARNMACPVDCFILLRGGMALTASIQDVDALDGALGRSRHALRKELVSTSRGFSAYYTDSSGMMRIDSDLPFCVTEQARVTEQRESGFASGSTSRVLVFRTPRPN
ncbi:hypothetical protein B0H11DRAFT_2246669 [Mycena galericulata]|nr:hypothetical protein B0H11DRAFT_2246669 [Mycena galericulata]